MLALQVGDPSTRVLAQDMTVAQMDDVLSTLVGTFNEREQRLNARTDAALANAGTLKSGLRLLFDKYQSALDGMEENLPEALNPQDPILNELLLIGEDALRDASNLLEDAARFEREAVRERIQTAENELIAEQERMNLILSTYKRGLERAELRLAESRRKEADLVIQIQQLVSQGPVQAHTLGSASPTKELSTGPADQTQLLRVMQEQFASQMQQLQAVKAATVGNAATVEPVLQNQTPAMTPFQTSRDVINRAEPTPRPQFSVTLQPSSVPEFDQHIASQLKGAIPTTLEEAIGYIRQLETGANAAVVNQLRDVEKRSTQLTTRVNELETELKTYQEYMRNTILEYKKKLQALNAQASKVKGIKPLQEASKLPPL